MKRIGRVALWLWLPFLPISGLACLIVFDAINPMRLAFIAEFEVENRSGEAIRVTPVGAYGSPPCRAVLPQYLTRFVGFVSLDDASLRVGSGESIRISFDCDDISLAELVIEGEKSKLVRQLVADPDPTANRNHPPLQERFVVGSLAQLPAPQPDVLKVAEAPRSRAFAESYYAVLLLGLAHLAALLPVLLLYQRANRASSGPRPAR